MKGQIAPRSFPRQGGVSHGLLGRLPELAEDFWKLAFGDGAHDSGRSPSPRVDRGYVVHMGVDTVARLASLGAGHQRNVTIHTNHTFGADGCRVRYRLTHGNPPPVIQLPHMTGHARIALCRRPYALVERVADGSVVVQVLKRVRGLNREVESTLVVGIKKEVRNFLGRDPLELTHGLGPIHQNAIYLTVGATHHHALLLVHHRPGPRLVRVEQLDRIDDGRVQTLSVNGRRGAALCFTAAPQRVHDRLFALHGFVHLLLLARQGLFNGIVKLVIVQDAVRPFFHPSALVQPDARCMEQTRPLECVKHGHGICKGTTECKYRGLQLLRGRNGRSLIPQVICLFLDAPQQACDSGKVHITFWRPRIAARHADGYVGAQLVGGDTGGTTWGQCHGEVGRGPPIVILVAHVLPQRCNPTITLGTAAGLHDKVRLPHAHFKAERVGHGCVHHCRGHFERCTAHLGIGFGS
eukprot:m.43048 g.43048  ORF g.43048 m.43048 type:complete len:466 (+) comp6355_c0_seq1:74-1471(+)